jgi:RNA polymerase sigma-70 factor (ECF subfamily)
MVTVRADPRLVARVDPSDVVQDTLAEAAARLDEYRRRRPLPFYPWLRGIAQHRLAALYRRHVQARRRSVTREERALGLPDRSALALAERLVARTSSPSAGAWRTRVGRCVSPPSRRRTGPASPRRSASAPGPAL